MVNTNMTEYSCDMEGLRAQKFCTLQNFFMGFPSHVASECSVCYFLIVPVLLVCLLNELSDLSVFGSLGYSG